MAAATAAARIARGRGLAPGAPAAPGGLSRVLSVLAPVRAGEGPTALLLCACVFALLCAYYVLKTAREGLILSGGMLGIGGDELKLYASGAMALLFAGIVPAYGALASRVGRARLIGVSYGIVIACLAIFFLLARAGVPIGLPFFLWLGLVNMFLVAQFWSYANDLYTEEQGQRLFAIIGLGGAAGAIVGPQLAHLAGTHALLLLAGAILAGVLALLQVIERRQPARAAIRTRPIAGAGGFTLVLRDRYLLWIAALVVVANLVNSVGEFVLSHAAAQHAAELVPQAAFPELAGPARAGAIEAARREIIKAFYADFFSWVNLAGFLAQAFVVSRVLGRFGVRAALFALPVIALGAYGAIGAAGGLALVRAAKIAENATDYSLQNTVRQALYLPTDRAVKYKAKAAIDTFCVRFGDTLSAVLVGVGIHRLGLAPREIALANLALVGVWLAIAAAIARRHRALDGRAADEPAPAPRAGARP